MQWRKESDGKRVAAIETIKLWQRSKEMRSKNNAMEKEK